MFMSYRYTTHYASLLGEPAGKANHSAFTGYQEFSSPGISYGQG